MLSKQITYCMTVDLSRYCIKFGIIYARIKLVLIKSADVIWQQVVGRNIKQNLSFHKQLNRIHQLSSYETVDFLQSICHHILLADSVISLLAHFANEVYNKHCLENLLLTNLTIWNITLHQKCQRCLSFLRMSNR